jgi:hypothetical protein
VRWGLLGDLSGEGVLCGEGERGDFCEIEDGILFIMIFGVKGVCVLISGQNVLLSNNVKNKN